MEHLSKLQLTELLMKIKLVNVLEIAQQIITESEQINAEPELSWQELGSGSGYFQAFYKDETDGEWMKLGAVTRDNQGYFSYPGCSENYQDISEAVRALYECNCNVDQQKAS